MIYGQSANSELLGRHKEKKLKIASEVITPDMARSYLESNGVNRNISDSRVRGYSRAMSRGEWQFVGDPIRFSISGRLLDGQHRLSAVIDSGKTVEFLVISGLPEDSIEVMDNGWTREFRHLLSLHGHNGDKVLSGAIRLLWEYRTLGTIYAAGGRSAKMSGREGLEILRQNPTLPECLVVAKQIRVAGLKLPPSVGAVMVYLTREADRAAADRFWEQVIEGVGLNASDPAYLLRRLLMQRPSNNTTPQLKTLAALIIKAFNFFRRGEDRRLLSWKVTEDFPSLSDVVGGGIVSEVRSLTVEQPNLITVS